MMNYIDYIRVVRESGGLGDSIRVLAVCQGLRKKYPQARIHYYGAHYLENLIVPRSAAFDLYIPCQYGIRNREEPLDEKKFAHLARKITYKESHCCWCWAYLHEPRTEGVVCQDRIELWCEHANVEPCRPYLAPTISDLRFMKLYKKRHRNKKIIGFQVGATCRSREWPFSYWNELAKLLLREGLHVILFDVCHRWAGEITADIEKSISRPWPETIGKLLSCNLVVTPDSGFYHLAGALRIKTLGLFGCTSGQIISRPWNWEVRTHDYIQLEHNEINYSKLPEECQPICYMRYERGWRADRYRGKEKIYCELMNQITPDRVFSKIKEKLRNG